MGICESLDGDGNGVVDFSEFVIANIDPHLESQEQLCWKAFKLFDLDGSGFIERIELGKLLGGDIATESHDDFRPTDEEIDEMYTELDTNKDGKIDFPEFERILHRLSLPG